MCDVDAHRFLCVRRVAFTEEDRDHLAYYLATRCPTRDGRMGNVPYKDLERLVRGSSFLAVVWRVFRWGYRRRRTTRRGRGRDAIRFIHGANITR